MSGNDLNASETNSLPPSPLPSMDHEEALRQMAVEKYLLNEMTPDAREQFEQHFFDCLDCATDLRVTSAFLDQAKQQLGSLSRRPLATPPKPAKRAWVELLFRPAIVSPLFAVMLLLVVFQPFRPAPMSLEAPEVLASASLVGGNSRGAGEVRIAVADHKPILLSIDVPAQEQFSSYELALTAPSGATLWRMPISAEQAKDTVSVRVPTAHWVPGEYSLVVFGHTNSLSESKDLAHYRFNVSNSTGR